MRSEQTAADAIRTLRDGRGESSPTLAQPSHGAADPCNDLQHNATGKDEGRRMNDEEEVRSSSSLSPARGQASASPSSLSLPLLSARQITAINLLMLGKSVISTAAALKIAPSTIHRWKSSNPQFLAELNRRQHDAFDQIVTKLRMSMGEAVNVLHAMLTGDRSDLRCEAMWKMLSYMKPQKLLAPSGPTDARDVIDQKIRESRQLRGEIVEAPIGEEDRVAWVEAQSLSSDNTKCGTGLGHVKESKDEDTESDHGRGARATGNAQTTSDTGAIDRCSGHHVPEARATLNVRERDAHNTRAGSRVAKRASS